MSKFIGIAIALICLGMVTFPLLQIIPSKRQQQIGKLRQAALKLGLRVQIRPPDIPHELQNQYPESSKAVAYYLPTDGKLLNGTFLALRSKNDNEWFWPNQSLPPANLMAEMIKNYQDLPSFCYAIEQGKAGTAVFLDENFDEEILKPLHQTLLSLNILISK